MIVEGNRTQNDKIIPAEEEEVERAIENSGSHELKWAKFCMMPYHFEPIRMPSFFPIPTHIFARRIIKNVVVGPTGLNSFVWTPAKTRSIGMIAGTKRSPSNDNIETIPELQDLNYQSSDWGPSNTFPTVYDVTDSVSEDIASGGVRLIGAYLCIDYLGKVDDISGIIEVGMQINSQLENFSPTFWREGLHFSTLREIQQQYQYRKYRIDENVKLIWIPVDSERFRFGRVSRHQVTTPEVLADPTTTPPTEAVPAVAELGYDREFGTNPLHITGYAHNTKMSWNINVTTQVDVPMRFTIVQYYESVPDEDKSDDYYPKAPHSAADTDTARKVVHSISKKIDLSRSKESRVNKGHILKRIYEVGKEYLPTILGTLNTARTAYQYARPFLASGPKFM